MTLYSKKLPNSRQHPSASSVLGISFVQRNRWIVGGIALRNLRSARKGQTSFFSEENLQKQSNAAPLTVLVKKKTNYSRILSTMERIPRLKAFTHENFDAWDFRRGAYLRIKRLYFIVSREEDKPKREEFKTESDFDVVGFLRAAIV